MYHELHRVVSFESVAPFELKIVFSDESVQTIDFEPILRGPMYGPLRDINVFNQVKLDEEVHTLVWPNGADFDPETLHDWPKYRQAWIDQSSTWKTLSSNEQSAECLRSAEHAG